MTGVQTCALPICVCEGSEEDFSVFGVDVHLFRYVVRQVAIIFFFVLFCWVVFGHEKTSPRVKADLFVWVSTLL